MGRSPVFISRCRRFIAVLPVAQSREMFSRVLLQLRESNERSKSSKFGKFGKFDKEDE
jgi:hypothetical protein